MCVVVEAHLRCMSASDAVADDKKSVEFSSRREMCAIDEQKNLHFLSIFFILIFLRTASPEQGGRIGALENGATPASIGWC